MEVYTRGVALPDLDEGVANRLAACVENASAKPAHLADAGRGGVVENQQIVVRVERQLVRIERPLGLLGRERERLGESTGHSEKRGGNAQRLEKMAAR